MELSNTFRIEWIGDYLDGIFFDPKDTVPSVPSNFLLETGDVFLLETGDNFLLE